MIATNELRRMLDERGVAHSDHYLSTAWRDGHGILHLAGEPMADGLLIVDMLTPEQAISATLGGEERTCHIEHPFYGDAPVINGKPRCSECKAEFAVGAFPNYCPNCGAKVVSE